MINLINGDFFEKVKDVPDKSVDMIWADIPYGTTNCHWDEIWSLEQMWVEFNRIARHNRVPVVMTASEPFNVDLAYSNRKQFKYSWIWQKNKASNFANANRTPMKYHELILVFYDKAPVYRPIKTTGHTLTQRRTRENRGGDCFGDMKNRQNYSSTERYPSSIQKFNIVSCKISASENRIRHPTEKPVDLIEYMIKTYTNKGDTVFDPCMGTGSSALAAYNTDRNYVGIEIDKDYYDTAMKRLDTIRE